MSWFVAGATVVGGVLSYKSDGKAADAQKAGTDAAISEQRRQFDTLLGLTAPQRSIGNQALNALASSQGYQPYTEGVFDDSRQVGTRVFKPSELGSLLGQGYGVDDVLKIGTFQQDAKTSDINWLMQTYGLTPDDVNRLQRGTFSAPESALNNSGAGGQPAGQDYSAFYASPDYQFRLKEGLKTVQNSAAAQGGLYSGNALRGVTEYGQGLAAGEYGNWFNRNAALAGIGQTATTQAGNAAMQTGANIGNLFAMQGDSRASGIAGQGNALSNTIGQLASLYGYWSSGGKFGKPGG